MPNQIICADMGTKIVESRYIDGVDEIRKIKNKYKETLNCFGNLPDYNRKRAERRFLILREFEEYFSVNEKKRLGKKYKVHVARKIFCKQKGISLTGVYRILPLPIKKS